MKRHKDYKAFYAACEYNQEQLLDEWMDMSLLELPERLHRGKRRKNEPIEEWKERGLYILSTNPPKVPAAFTRLFGHQFRSPETLRNVMDFFDATEEDLRHFGHQSPKTPALAKFETETEISQREANRNTEEGLQDLRTLMTVWIWSTLATKQSEATCDLRCFVCGSPMLLLCAAQNLTAIKNDATIYEELDTNGVTVPNLRELLNA